MKKLIRFFSVLFLTSSATISGTEQLVTQTINIINNDNNSYLKSSVLAESKNNHSLNYQTAESGNPVFASYIDSTGNQLNYRPNWIILRNQNVGNNTWNWNYYQFETIKIADYAASKTEFINNFKGFNIYFSFAYNTWNDEYGWSNGNGKNAPFANTNYYLNLTGNDENQNLIHYSDPNHSNNEAIDLCVITTWNNVTGEVSFSFQLGLWYHWASGSIYNHAAFLGVKLNDFKTIPDAKIKLQTHYLQSISTTNYSSTTTIGWTADINNLFNDALTFYSEATAKRYQKITLNKDIYSLITKNQPNLLHSYSLQSGFGPLANELYNVILSGKIESTQNSIEFINEKNNNNTDFIPFYNNGVSEANIITAPINIANQVFENLSLTFYCNFLITYVLT